MMTVQDRYRFAEKVFNEKIRALLVSKGADYGGSIANSNFYSAGDETGVGPLAVWYVYFHKHLSSLKNFIAKGKVESEPIEGRIDDLITYLFILRSILEEGEKK